jgi:hypothetical protein
MRYIGLFFFSVLLACSQQESNEEKETTLSEADKSPYQVIVEETPGCGWGYKIMKDGQLSINQPTIPAIQGNRCFSSKEKAEKTAEFIINKMNNNVFPPTISLEELDSLGVLE